MSWNTTSVWLKVALVSILLATVLFVLGFATNEWMADWYGHHSWGLWKAKWCNSRGCSVSKITSYMLEQRDMEGKTLELLTPCRVTRCLIRIIVERHSSVGSVADLRTGGRWFDPG